ncbi:MAG: hypothetical protein M1840_003248 [Geoglossum simile]|nr:MAG: hypothetical protein M1840_003248 [Geoglossum simile]
MSNTSPSAVTSENTSHETLNEGDYGDSFQMEDPLDFSRLIRGEDDHSGGSDGATGELPKVFEEVVLSLEYKTER